ncbi:hypothetical protein NDU88_007468 [Pleurodeles waltl]|uniref:Uncharacterized protein n=1 Tax=Pleurodeles waltl TaxID=8319 RepID=A0AAV7VSL9_PLEWA|nr:hypothetical protein NDU88_007468 [Pleurodeles waltl]
MTQENTENFPQRNVPTCKNPPLSLKKNVASRPAPSNSLIQQRTLAGEAGILPLGLSVLSVVVVVSRCDQCSASAMEDQPLAALSIKNLELHRPAIHISALLPKKKVNNT